MDFPASPTLNQTYTYGSKTWKWNGHGWELNATSPLSGYAGASTITTVGTINTGVWNGTPVSPVYGGTGLSTYTAGNYINASSSSTLQQRTPAQVLSDIGAQNLVGSGDMIGTNTWYIERPNGGSKYLGGSATGAIAIKLPVGFTAGMLNFRIRLFKYTTGGAFDVLIGGYTYNGTGTGGYWVGATAAIQTSDSVNNNYTVRFGSDGTNPVVYIGELASSWLYTHVQVVDVGVAQALPLATRADYESGWSVTLETTAFGATPNGAAAAVSSNNLVDAQTAFQLNGQNPSYYLDLTNVTGTLADARLSANVPLKNATNTFSAGNTFTGANTFSAINTFSAGNQAVEVKAGATANHVYIGWFADSASQSTRSGYMGYASAGTTHFTVGNERTNGDIQFITNGTGSLKFNTQTVWHAGNDGVASGLDADLLDAQQGSYYLALANATGTLPDARLSGTYTDLSVKVAPSGSIFSTSSVATDNRVVSHAVSYRSSLSAATGAIVLSAPAVDTVMYLMHIYGMLFVNDMIDANIKGYTTTGAWSNTNLQHFGTARPQVRLGRDASNRPCVILGDVATVWSYPHIAMDVALFSHVGADDPIATGWTSALVTDLSAFTSVTVALTDAGVPQANVANLTTDLAAKAPLASPIFTTDITVPGAIKSTSVINVLNASAAQGMKVGSLVVSNSYGNNAPTNGIYSTGQIQSAVATGTPPLIVASTTAVTNLNTDLLDGQHGSYYLDLTNVTGTLPAGRFPALTGAITTTAGSLATTLAASAVGLSNMADVATGSVFYRKSAGTGAPEVQTLATLKTDLGLTGTNSGDQTITLTGNVTGSGTGSFATTIANGVVTLAMQANMATGSLIGRSTAGSGTPEVITVGSGLSISAGVLTATGGTGTVTAVSIATSNGVSGSSSGGATPALTIALGAITPSSVAASGTVTGSNLSGTNTGDQTITLTGNITGSGTGSFATTIAAGVVTLANMANVATGTIFYRKTAATGVPEVQTLATLKTDLGLTGTNSGDQTITLTGNVTGSGTGSFATTIANGVVTLAMQANMATGSLIGRSTAGAGVPEIITVGSGLSLSAGVLTATGGSGTVTAVSIATANGVSGSSSGGATPALTIALGAITPSSVAASGTVTGSNLSGTHTGTSSGTNTGDQTITLTGNVTGSGTGSFATTIAAGVVTLAMQANMATGSLVYRKTAGAGAPEVQTLATLKTDLGLTGTNSGDQTTITGNAGTATTLQTARTIAVSGKATGTATSFNGSANITIPITAVTLLAGDIPALPWSQITSGKPTTLSGYGITDGVSSAGSVTFGGSVTSSQSFISTNAAAIVASTGAGSVNLRPNGAASTTGQLTLSSSGVATAVDFSASSDRRLKTDITDLVVNKRLIPKRYVRIENNVEEIGFIAQDVQEAYPELVTENGEGMLTLSYGKITAVLAAQLNDANDRIAKLESILAKLVGAQ